MNSLNSLNLMNQEKSKSEMVTRDTLCVEINILPDEVVKQK